MPLPLLRSIQLYNRPPSFRSDSFSDGCFAYTRGPREYPPLLVIHFLPSLPTTALSTLPVGIAFHLPNRSRTVFLCPVLIVTHLGHSTPWSRDPMKIGSQNNDPIVELRCAVQITGRNPDLYLVIPSPYRYGSILQGGMINRDCPWNANLIGSCISFPIEPEVSKSIWTPLSETSLSNSSLANSTILPCRRVALWTSRRVRRKHQASG